MDCRQDGKQGGTATCSFQTAHDAQVTLTAPSYEHHHDGLGVNVSRPRISWTFLCANAEVRDWVQTSYEIEISNEEARVDTGTGSFAEQGCQSSLVPWPSTCPSLHSRERRSVRVRCVGTYRIANESFTEPTPWSPWSAVEAALLKRDDWKAEMITIADPVQLNDDGSLKPLVFCKGFEVPKSAAIERARLYVTSHGVYHATLNGVAVGDHCMAPGWQSYHKRLHYQVFDVSSLISAGENELMFDVGPGWFASALTSNNYRYYYGKELGILGQLEITFRLEQTVDNIAICTDSTWRCGPSPSVSSEIFNGEVFCQRIAEQMDEGKEQVMLCKTKVSSTTVSELVSPETPPVRVTQTIWPVAVLASPSEKTILDFGQNLVGRVQVQAVQKPAGHRIVFRHAEVLEDGELCVRPLREARQTDTIICSGKPLKGWTPRFTFHGFRYVEVTGWSPSDATTPLTIDSVCAQVLHTDMMVTGYFDCSNAEINQLHANAVWSLRGNFLSVPTDCPARDDREGWTGDLAIFIPVVQYVYNTTGMLINWLSDLYADQMSAAPTWSPGVVPLVVPNCFEKLPQHINAGAWGQGWDPLRQGIWGDACIIVPWELYRSTGDLDILARQYDSMIQYLYHGVSRGHDYLWDPQQWQFGDWLDPAAPVNNSSLSRTDGTFVADCFLLQSTRILSHISSLLQHTSDRKRYRKQYHVLLQTFQNKYVSRLGLLVPDTPTAIALALHLRLLPKHAIPTCSARLRHHLRRLDFRIPTGFAGTASLLWALGMTAQPDLAFTMLLSDARPGLMYGVRNGATTIWERWDALTTVQKRMGGGVEGGQPVVESARVNEGSMTSFNHYALGAVVGWLQRGVGGLRIAVEWEEDEEAGGGIDANADAEQLEPWKGTASPALDIGTHNKRHGKTLRQSTTATITTSTDARDATNNANATATEIYPPTHHRQSLTGTVFPSSSPPPPLTLNIAPQIHHALTHASSQHLTRCGWASCRWRFLSSLQPLQPLVANTGRGRESDPRHTAGVEVSVVIPPNARARVQLRRGRLVGAGDGVEGAGGGVESGEGDEDVGDFDEMIGSGTYTFECVYDVGVDGGEYPVQGLLPPWGRAAF